jgi:bifunctional DNA-binding transcriptional regulator/antitoxin component of YhaV-PrlF toxin-antitoxin module
MMSEYTVQVIEEDGELVLPLPKALLVELGWRPGDTLKWTDNEDGTFTIVRAE